MKTKTVIVNPFNLKKALTMKNSIIKSVLFIALYSILCSGYAQDTLQQWNVGVYDRNWNPPETTRPFWITNIYRTGSDTLINSISYKKLFFSNDTLFANHTYFGAIRKHNGEILINKNNNEYLLYNFSLSVDDTIFINRFIDNEPFVWKAKVNAISEILINNRTLKKYEVSYSDTNNNFTALDNDIWIEDIGSKKYGLLNEGIPPNLTGPDKDFYLLCYKENDETVLYDTNFNTCFKKTIESGISLKLNKQCKIYPTVLTSNTQLVVESSILINQIKIFDLQGLSVYTKNIGSLYCHLNLSYLKNGFYIVVVNNNTFKLLITR